MFEKILRDPVKGYEEYLELLQEERGKSDRARICAKQAIGLLRRANFEEAKKRLEESEAQFRDLSGLLDRQPRLACDAVYRSAVEEYVEAKALYAYLSGSEFELPEVLTADEETILGGIADFTGELVRRATVIADVETEETLDAYRQEVEEISGVLIKVGFGGPLRQKLDHVERDLRRLENMLYDIRLKKD
jgi:predicted translin family RNA/ssDNA-binding protein